MSTYGKLIPKYYDAFMGDENHILTPLKKLLKKHHIHPKKVLELGCGTGTVLLSLAKKTQLYGLDISKDMLKEAKRKIPQGIFYQMDMSNFSLSQTFDVILCMFDAINHLNNFWLWKKTFLHVSKHLQKEGYFIFDINTLERLTYIASTHAFFGFTISDDTVVFSQTIPTKKKNFFKVEFSFLHKKRKKLYSLEKDYAYESAFSVEKIKKALQRWFFVEEIMRLTVEKSNPHSQRVFFVCKKK